MKPYKFILLAALGGIMQTLPSCVSEDPFAADGEATVRMKVILNGEITRAVSEEEQASLADNITIYVSGQKGLLYKYHGLSALPEKLTLRSGDYTFEAWAGDSVSASFDKRFFKAYQKEQISEGPNTIMLNCKIANVLACVNAESVFEEQLKNYTITVGHTRGSVDFTSDNVATAHAYFMMPNGVSTLTYKISGENAAGTQFEKEGVIENVKSAHEYILNLRYDSNAAQDDKGGSFIKVSINDEEVLVEDRIELHGAPRILGGDFDITAPVKAAPGEFSAKAVQVYCYGKLQGLKLNFSDQAAFGLPAAEFDLTGIAPSFEEQLAAAGLTWNERYDEATKHTLATVYLSADILNRLPEGDHSVEFTATCGEQRIRTQMMNIAVNNDPVTLSDPAMADIASYSAALSLESNDAAQNPGIEYRKASDAQWTRVNVNPTRAAHVVKITNLSPATTYEVRAVADGFTAASVKTFTTDPVFTIPNAGFENWFQDGKVAYPASDMNSLFWGTGNPAAASFIGSNSTSTTEIKHGGQYAAKLESKNAYIKLAAGNIFIGEFLKIDGTDGILSFGRPFDGSHPVKLRGWAHYRPGAVNQGSQSNCPAGAPASGEKDHGQIFCALTSAPKEIRTKASNRQLFDPDENIVIAYGQVTWTDNFGPDGDMQQFEITLDWRNRNVKPTYICITASASKYGDFYYGSDSSVMYLDDLELVYE